MLNDDFNPDNMIPYIVSPTDIEFVKKGGYILVDKEGKHYVPHETDSVCPKPKFEPEGTGGNPCKYTTTISCGCPSNGYSSLGMTGSIGLNTGITGIVIPKIYEGCKYAENHDRYFNPKFI